MVIVSKDILPMDKCSWCKFVFCFKATNITTEEN